LLSGGLESQERYFTSDVDMAEMVAMELDIKFTRPKRRRQKVTTDHQQLMERRKSTIEGADEAASTEVTKYTSLPPRPPVVCIMGHVDHGKTTLMDSLRRRSNSKDSKNQKQKKAKKAAKKGKASQEGDVAGTESGGITQQISVSGERFVSRQCTGAFWLIFATACCYNYSSQAFQVPLGGQKDAITFLDTPGR
jgi:Elongation factor Tu GTP binding domain